MSIITRWLTQIHHFCSNCFNLSLNNENTSQSSDYYSQNIRNLVKHCSKKKDSICSKCFLTFFGYDRFIIRQLFVYLNQQQQQQTDDYIHIKQFSTFAEHIINWHELINNTDFTRELFHILLSTNKQREEIDSSLVYELIKDAFFFTAIQSNVQTILTNESQIFLEKFFTYLNGLNQDNTSENYIKLIKRLLPWIFMSIHKWFKNCLLSTRNQTERISKEFNSNIPLTFLWYITSWLVSNKAFPNEYDPISIFEKVCQQEFFTNIYDSDQHGYSIVILCQCTYHIDGPFLFMFYCNDERIFAILLEGKLMDSVKPYGGRSSLCLQLSPQFNILERGPSMLYWNVKNRSDGPLAIRIGHNGMTRVSFDLNMEHIYHPHGSSSINRIEIYKFGLYKTPSSTPLILQNSVLHKQHDEYNIFSVDAHKLAESIGIHLFT